MFPKTGHGIYFIFNKGSFLKNMEVEVIRYIGYFSMILIVLMHLFHRKVDMNY